MFVVYFTLVRRVKRKPSEAVGARACQSVRCWEHECARRITRDSLRRGRHVGALIVHARQRDEAAAGIILGCLKCKALIFVNRGV